LCSQSKEAEGGGDREGHRRRERDQSTDLLFTVFVLDRGHIVDLRHVRRDGRAGEGDLHDEEHEGHEGDQTQRAKESSISRGNPHTIHQSILPLPRERERERETGRERQREIETERGGKGVSRWERDHRYLQSALVVVLLECHRWLIFQFRPTQHELCLLIDQDEH
jgi:hypothetical protein